jgi:hypothetical protein
VRRASFGRGLALLALAGSTACDGCRSSTPAERPALSLRGYARETAYVTGDPATDALQDLLRPTLEANRREFLGRTGTVHGIGAGEIYPQVWLRDSATVIPASRYADDLDALASWLEEHLAHQKADGQLWDWIAAGEPEVFRVNAPRAQVVFRQAGTVLSADKNTSITDQESSAVDAAAQLYVLGGRRDWLAKDVAGRRLLDRLEAALEFVWRDKRQDGLVVAALTADWGDVSPAYPDQRVIYLDDATPRVASLYASVLFVRGARGLAGLFEAASEPGRAATWTGRADATRDAIARGLWQEDRGFFRFQRTLPGPPAPPALDTSGMFALGGNALAALYGIADDAQAARIFAEVEARRRRYALSTVAGVLLPPFPRGFFPHPIQSEEWTYQNGGLWDWWAGRLLLAEFLRGDAADAQRQLREIAARVARTGGLFEWSSRKEKGQGSAHYAGSAGALAGAVFAGLFGIDSRKDALAITVRLGEGGGAVRVYEPAIDRYVAYRYDAEPRALRLRFESNAPGTGELALRLPPDRVGASARLDGRPLAFAEKQVGRDRYLSLVTDWQAHELQVDLR